MTATTKPKVTLDWGGSNHSSRRQAGCVHCHLPTHLRDPAGRPSHKTCAERAITAARQRQAPPDASGGDGDHGHPEHHEHDRDLVHLEHDDHDQRGPTA